MNKNKCNLCKLILKGFLYLGIFTLVSCAGKPLYYWGEYEDSIYDHYDNKTSPTKEIDELRADELKARNARLPHPPGYYAYLGFLYYQVGDVIMAQKSFEAEKNQFPESALLMNRLIKPSAVSSSSKKPELKRNEVPKANSKKGK